MYKKIVRPVLFSFDPETIHHLAFRVIKSSSAFSKLITPHFFQVNSKKLERNIAGLNFKNPVGIAAGFDKNAELINELEQFGFGFIEIGTVTPRPQQGNPLPRLFRLPDDQALINRMGFNNEGVDAVVQRLKNRNTKLKIGGNIGKNTDTPNEKAKEDYIYCFNALYDYVDYFVVNVSCPNVKDLTKLQDVGFLEDLLLTLNKINEEKGANRPIFIKISPDLNSSQLDDIIQLISITNIAGVIATNTSAARENLTYSNDKINQIGNGGLSGSPIREKSTKTIKYLSDNSNKAFAIIGVGGIMSAEDALEKINAGADLVQVFTGFIYEGPRIVKEINQAILRQ